MGDFLNSPLGIALITFAASWGGTVAAVKWELKFLRRDVDELRTHVFHRRKQDTATDP